jgi:Phage tail assembly chaperone protein, TAC
MQLCAAGVYDLRLTPAEFWDLTPREFNALWDRHIAAEERHDRRIALICTLYANAHRDEKKRSTAFEITDFMPKYGEQEPAFDGPAFLKPCAECGVAKWQGHMEWCKTGQRHFGQAIDRAKATVKEANEMIERHGKPFAEKR